MSASGFPQVNMSPPHISQIPAVSYATYPVPQQQPLPMQAQDPNFQVQNVANIGQNYRDQLFAQCAMGNHERKTEYGICGIITAVVLFPIGLICLFIDTNVKCTRCGIALAK